MNIFFKNTLFFLILFSQILSEYEVINAFPNLSFSDPVGIYHANDGSNRLFVVEQTGKIKVFNNNSSEMDADVFLDIESIVDQGGGYTEEGLLGLAFHPNFIDNGIFYVNYTDYSPRRNVIAQYSVSDNDPNQADHQSAFIIMEVNQPYSNHNGGQMGFGPDGYLYISFGDGGGGGDPLDNGQDLLTLLGSIIRIDINTTGPSYTIPSDNPFIAQDNAQPEIYAYGLRNMWRFSWDSETNLLWGADVGQNSYEEIDIIHSGLNYGWNTMEANHCYPPGTNCDSDGLEPPIWEYELYVDGVCSITGGFVYRGNSMPSLYGKYIYGDWCTGDMWALNYVENGITENEHLLTTDINITSFGLDESNELFFSGNEYIYMFTPEFENMMGDVNGDMIVNVLDVIQTVNMALGYQEPNYDTADLNQDGVINILDIIQIVNIILNPLSEQCYILPEVGPCEGICPTYYYNQETNQCEEFITGCCGIEVFESYENCTNTCE